MTAPADDFHEVAPGRSWIDRRAPAPTRPYLKLMRLDRPIGTWLLLIPCWWGLALAPRPDGFSFNDARLALLFAVGALVMRGAGCTVNDILDRKIDAEVARTRSRPIPSGQVSVLQALVFLAAQLAVGLVVLLQFDWPTIRLGIASLVLVFTYPLAKRVTWWPQIYLGLAFNWGVLMGWTSVTGGLAWPPTLLYLAGIVWTLGYDTVYAHQDKRDDVRIGVKSTALRLGRHSRAVVGACYAAAIGLAAVAGSPRG